MLRRSAFRGTLLAFLVALAGIAPATPAAAAANPDAARVIHIAEAQAGDPWVSGMTGPRGFDCSGLVYYAFREAGLLRRIGGSRRSAEGYLQWFRRHGRAGRSDPRPGDLVIWGRGEHIGIY